MRIRTAFIVVVLSLPTTLSAESDCVKQCKRDNWNSYMQYREGCGDDEDCKERAWDGKLTDDADCAGRRCGEQGPAHFPAHVACPQPNDFVYDREARRCVKRAQSCDHLRHQCPEQPK